MIKKKICLLFVIFFSFNFAQTEIKINLASAALLIPNIGIEFKISENLGYQLDTSASFWDSIDNNPMLFMQVFNELRYYPKKYNRTFFIAPHIGYGMFLLKSPKILTSIVDTQFKPEGSYQSGRNTYYGFTVGKKIKLKNPKFELELFIGGGSSQSNYKYYNSLGELEFDDPNAKRNFSKSGEELVYKGGLMLVYKLESCFLTLLNLYFFLQ